MMDLNSSDIISNEALQRRGINLNTNNLLDVNKNDANNASFNKHNKSTYSITPHIGDDRPEINN